MNGLQDFLIKKREELKLSLRNASKLIGISHSYLSTLEKGIDPRNNAPVRPTPETLQIISNAYNVSYDYLMQLAGYISIENNESHLTKKDEKDIEKRLDKIKTELMESQDGLMLSGNPVSPEAIQSIVDALEFGMRQAKVINKKYIPKKYREDKDE